MRQHNPNVLSTWTCLTCGQVHSSNQPECELCLSPRPIPRIPAAVIFCGFLSLVKFSVTALLPFYGTHTPTDPSSIRTFLIADSLSLENLAHCGLTMFLSSLWWLTGVEFFGFGLLVVLFLLFAAATGELIVVVVSLHQHTTPPPWSVEIYGPTVFSSVFFVAVTLALMSTLLTRIDGRRRLSLFSIPSSITTTTTTTVVIRLRQALHIGLLVDCICSASIFLIESIIRAILLTTKPTVTNVTSSVMPHHVALLPPIVFTTFLPSFTKSFTVSMHHAAIITPGFVALRHLDNFLEVFLMVSIIFAPFFITRYATDETRIDSILAGVHGGLKVTNAIIGVLLRTWSPRSIVQNIKFDLVSFAQIKPTLFHLACAPRQSSMRMRIRLSACLTSVGVVLFNIFVPLEAVALLLNEKYRVPRGEEYDVVTLCMVCMSMNFGIHGAIAVPFLVGVYQNIWFYSSFRLIFALGGVLGFIMSIAEIGRFDVTFGTREGEKDMGGVERLIFVCLLARGVGMLLTAAGLATMGGKELVEGMDACRDGRRSRLSYNAVERGVEMREHHGGVSEDGITETEKEKETEEKIHGVQAEDGKLRKAGRSLSLPKAESMTGGTAIILKVEDNVVLVVGTVIDEKKEAMQWLAAGNWSLLNYAFSFGCLLIMVQVAGRNIRLATGSSTSNNVGEGALITGSLIGFDVAWHVLFFGLLLTWHGFITSNLLTLGIATGLVGSTTVTCLVAACMLTAGGQAEMVGMCVALWWGAASSFYLFWNCVLKLGRIF